MESKNKERWMELCEQAAVEQDPKKLLELTTEINLLLAAKELEKQFAAGQTLNRFGDRTR